MEDWTATSRSSLGQAPEVPDHHPGRGYSFSRGGPVPLRCLSRQGQRSGSRGRAQKGEGRQHHRSRHQQGRNTPLSNPVDSTSPPTTAPATAPHTPNRRTNNRLRPAAIRSTTENMTRPGRRGSPASAATSQSAKTTGHGSRGYWQALSSLQRTPIRPTRPRQLVPVSVPVSPGRNRHRGRETPAPTPGFRLRTDRLSWLVNPLSRMGFRGSRVQIPPSRLCKSVGDVSSGAARRKSGVSRAT
jgi:hypothetical protein